MALGKLTAVRAAGLVLVSTSATAGVVLLVGAQVRPTSRDDFSALLTRVSAAAVVLGCCWVTLVACAVAAEALMDGRCRAARFTGCPQRWRRWLLALCGVVVVASTTAPTYAAEQGGFAPGSGLPVPDRPAGAVAARPPQHGMVVVRAGDSLWRIAARELPPHADARSVDRLWRRIAARNLAVIGSDPDLIQPGQRLQLPTISDSEER